MKTIVTDKIRDFKNFAFNRGNIVDLSVAVVIGTSFTTLANSFANHILGPATSYLNYFIHIIPKYTPFEFKAFSGDLFNFAITAVSLYFLSKVIMKYIWKGADKMVDDIEHAIDPDHPYHPEPPTKSCPFCLSVIPFRATKCSGCLSEVEIPPIPKMIQLELFDEPNR